MSISDGELAEMRDGVRERMRGLVRRDDALATVMRDFPSFVLSDGLLTLCEMGSTAHGTSGHVIDDYDLMGVVIPPDRHLIGLGQWEHWVRPPKEDGLDVMIYSLEKWVSLALKNNPNVMGLLWTRPENSLFYHDHRWQQFLDHRDAFSSKKAYNSFSGYAVAQFRKMEHGAYRGFMGEKRKALVEEFGYDTKNAAHLIRLLRMGIEFLRTGELVVFRPDREELKAIKRGEWSLERVKSEAERLFADARDALAESPLPEEPDFLTVENLLMRAHREHLG